MMHHTLTDDAKRALDAHRQSIDDLHAKLQATPGVNKAKLQAVMDRYRTATLKFHEDVLGCMN